MTTPIPQGEVELFRDARVLVTTKRVCVGGETYSISARSSVRLRRERKRPTERLVLVCNGLFLVVVGVLPWIVPAARANGDDWRSVAVACVALGLGLAYVARRIGGRHYVVELASGAFSRHRLTTDDESTAAALTKAITKGIAAYAQR